MAHYWVESANDDEGEENENYFLFCQTADQRIFHVTKHQLIEFANAPTEDQSQLFLKPWDPIGANGKKRKRKKEKEKVKQEPRKKRQKEEEEEEEEEKPTVVILQAPTDQVSPVLPPEIMLMILENMSEPTPANRKFVFSFLKGPRRNAVSDELASSKTVLRWWDKVLLMEPPGVIVDMQRFYAERGDLKGFVRRWYSLFVRQYDTQRLIDVTKYYLPHDDQIMDIKLNRITMNTLMFHVRGRVIGTGKYWNAPLEYETLEMEIQRALDAGYEDPIVPAGHVYRPEVPLVLVYPLRKLMLKVVAKRESHNVGMWLIKFEEARWRAIRGRAEDLAWLRNSWQRTETNKKIFRGRIAQTMKVASRALRIMRGLEVGQRYTARDLTAYVWLCMVIIQLFYLPLEKAMKKTSLILRFLTDLREEVRFMELTEQEKKTESKLSAKERLSNREKRSENYYDTVWGAQYAWFAKWNPPRALEGGETPPAPPPGTYDDTDWVEDYLKPKKKEEEEEEEEETDMERHYREEDEQTAERQRKWTRRQQKWKRQAEDERLFKKYGFPKKEGGGDDEGMSSSSTTTSNNKFKTIASDLPKKEAAIQAYNTASEAAQEFIIEEIKHASKSFTNMKDFMVVINRFSDQFLMKLRVFKLVELWKVARDAGATRRNLANSERVVVRNGRRAIEQIIKKRKEEASEPEETDMERQTRQRNFERARGAEAMRNRRLRVQREEAKERSSSRSNNKVKRIASGSPKQEAAIQAYKTAVEAAEQFIVEETKQDVMNRVDTTHVLDKEYGEVAIDRFDTELMAKLKKLKLRELWQAAVDAGATQNQLGFIPKSVYVHGMRAFRRGIEKKKAKEAAIEVYDIAVKEAEQFIIAKINRALGTIKDVEKFEAVINLFGGRLTRELTKFKLGELRKAATVAGATRRELAKMQMTVMQNGHRAIDQSIKKKRENPEYGFSALKEAAVIQAYKTAVEAAEQFIMAETKQDVMDRVDTTPASKEYGEVAIHHFVDELNAKIKKLKLWDLWQEALDTGATQTQLGPTPRKVQMTGIRAFRRGVEKKKTEERSSRSNNKEFKGRRPTEFWN